MCDVLNCSVDFNEAFPKAVQLADKIKMVQLGNPAAMSTTLALSGLLHLSNKVE
jgi:hypothetical protein